jgi:hypothetical protein
LWCISTESPEPPDEEVAPLDVLPVEALPVPLLDVLPVDAPFAPHPTAAPEARQTPPRTTTHARFMTYLVAVCGVESQPL